MKEPSRFQLTICTTFLACAAPFIFWGIVAGVIAGCSQGRPQAKSIEFKLQKEMRQLSNNWGGVHAVAADDGKLLSIRIMYSLPNGYKYCFHGSPYWVPPMVSVYNATSDAALSEGSYDTQTQLIGGYYFHPDGKVTEDDFHKNPPMYDSKKLKELQAAAGQLNAVLAKLIGK
ncbi:hypothetical protein [Anatilimnocola floriformis]|uniref:hypothetical protein n=1 Tax=Anatilimnocola floriformis TaxID=2948575 RepID=UPI0020C4C3E1|nr:hypothetical protein [Anatilimnocola floriformis]